MTALTEKESVGRALGLWAKAVSLLTVAVVGLHVSIAESAPRFTHLGADNGLPAQTVWAMVQDRQGFIWLGTSAGLARYDGVETVVYRHDPNDSRSLVDDQVNALFVDRAGTLWVATDGGLCRYDARTDSFARFMTEPADASPGGDESALSIAETRDGMFWLGRFSGLERLDPQTGRVTRYEHDANDPGSLTDGGVWAVYVDREDHVWIGTLGGGLDRLSSGGSTFEHITLGPSNAAERTFLDDNVRAIREDSDGDIWVGTDGGLNRLNLATGARRFYGYDYDDPEDPKGLSDHYVNAILEDSSARLWIGTEKGGLERYDRATDRFVRYTDTSTSASTGGILLVTSILEDRTGLLWFAGRGVDRLDPASESLVAYKPPTGSSAQKIVAMLGTLPQTPALHVDKTGVVWIGDVSGLATFDPATRSWSAHLRVPNHPADNPVYALDEGADGFVYVGAPQSIALYLRRRGGFGPTSISLRGTPDVIYEDSSGVIWAGIPNVGLARLPGRHGEDQEYFTQTAGDPSSLSSNFPVFIYEDARKRFWVGTDDGLDLMDRETGRFQRVMLGAGTADESSHIEASAMAESAEGDLWIGTDHGLEHLSADAVGIRHYTASDGLVHDRVNALAFDGHGDLWVGTEGGLSRLTPVTGVIRNFRVEQGLPDNEVLRLGVGPNGDVYAETYGGLVSIRPGDLADTDVDPQIAIANVAIVNDGGSEPDPKRSAQNETRSAATGALTLTHHDMTVSFDLAVLDYREPERNRYAYMLEGLNRDWVYARGAQRRVTYTTLPAGHYRFLYRGADSTGRWSGTHAIEVNVLPAPWRTSWAYALYAIAAVLTAAAAVFIRTRAATARARELEATVQQRTRELSEQRDTIRLQSERLEEVVTTKDRLYTNVSHEFRTPLTVILGVLERLLPREHAPERRAHLDTVRRNAQRLLRLVEQLMGLARLDAARTVSPSPQPAGERVSLLVESFRTLAEDRGIDLTSRCDAAAWVSCDADSLEKIMINLLSNAVKYTESGGRIAVGVERKPGGYVELSVADTGIGIPKAQQRNLFTRFYRATDAAEIAPGSGLGLALVKELVSANRGEIDLVSEEGAGTTVRVRLPEAEASAATGRSGAGSNDAALEVAVLGAPTPHGPVSISDDSDDSSPGASRALIVEDNPDLCRHLEQVLGSDFRCQSANDGRTGLELAIETVPDVIICDVMLPKLNGFEVVRQLKQDDRTCHIPMILLTARADEESRLSGLRTLADDYVTKPFSEAELHQRVDRLLAIREILRQRYGRQLQGDGDAAQALSELGARDRRFLERLEQALDRRFSDTELSLGELAGLLAMSERQLQRKLKAVTDTTPREYLRDYRLKRALPMVEDGEPVSAVAFAVGFTSQSYFASCFKARFGMTPSEARSRGGQTRTARAPGHQDS